MQKKDINTREDIALLVNSFYLKVKQDTILGPIFNAQIKNWDAHLEHLTTFWESSLFISRTLNKKYSGNPLEAHIQADKKCNNALTEQHFGLWLNLWIETINDLFEGDIAENAKYRARKMSSFLYLKIFEAR